MSESSTEEVKSGQMKVLKLKVEMLDFFLLGFSSLLNFDVRTRDVRTCVCYVLLLVTFYEFHFCDLNTTIRLSLRVDSPSLSIS